MSVDDRWEVGGHFPLALESGVAQWPWSEHSFSRWGSGRDALRALVEWGRRSRGWRRLLLPSYFCQTVPAALSGIIELSLYEHAPTDTEPPLVPAIEGDVVVAPATFGAAPSVIVDAGVPVIEDHSHDPASPLAYESQAAYAFTSLRKTLPLPDGAVLWSPTRLPLPPEVPTTLEHDRAVLMQLSAMALKRDYLAGADVVKEDYLGLWHEGEEAIGSGPLSGMSAYSRSRLRTLPVQRWREIQALNLAAFRAVLGNLPDVLVLDVPFAIILVFRTASLCEHVRVAMLAERIYPAVLWPLNDPVVPGIPSHHVELAARLLKLPCDQRYSSADMDRVASVLRRACPAS